MDEYVRVKTVIVFESDSVEYQKLIEEFIEEIGCKIKMNKSIIREINA